MMLRFPVDPAKLESYAAENGDVLKAITDDAKSKGAIHHAFLEGEGEVIVIDEWDSPESFQSFFEGQEDIPKVMQAVGAGEPAPPTFMRKLDTGDDF